MSDTTEVPNLTLRRLAMSDAPAMHAIFADEEAMRYWSRLPHTDIAETQDWLAKAIAGVDAGEADEYAVEVDGLLVGRIGLWQGNELGLIFAPSVWGKGVARAAAEELIARSKARGVRSILADIDPRNGRVRAFLERLGFKKTGAAKSTYKLGDIWTDSEYLTLELSGEP